eukprot:TRINITY_DN11631_c0_g1_i2.p1 TRINITY_DN11631_c0_g1~~TRINITY_DN11631_c0_g1_i2.p1  ORF type:complete len:150 (-),score=22.69 TRINITY_DN11631_c0_g1_i2:110-559(-)
MFDTASDTGPWYKTEKIIGDLISDPENTIPRKDLFFITKLHPQDHGIKNSENSLKKSLKNLKTDYVDLFLIHYMECWGSLCSRSPEGTWKESWKIMEKYYHAGVIRAIGVSNFHLPQLAELLEISTVKPHVIQDWHDPFHVSENLSRSP